MHFDEYTLEEVLGDKPTYTSQSVSEDKRRTHVNVYGFERPSPLKKRRGARNPFADVGDAFEAVFDDLQAPLPEISSAQDDSNTKYVAAWEAKQALVGDEEVGWHRMDVKKDLHCMDSEEDRAPEGFKDSHAEGAAAYATRQADLHERIADKFETLWEAEAPEYDNEQDTREEEEEGNDEEGDENDGEEEEEGSVGILSDGEEGE
ncbi:hypothetical protein B0H17DRAFT_1209190 [Mycena rosella]|uniref:Uncharacterized protein n=1 Tax=Mycena rosella TaxID=1033263 RepID=A0AAD7CZ33_MYCRO|nr:hypothetical protein B0H17DRAFT_1209190 [Mycena rosella]